MQQIVWVSNRRKSLKADQWEVILHTFFRHWGSLVRIQQPAFGDNLHTMQERIQEVSSKPLITSMMERGVCTSPAQVEDVIQMQAVKSPRVSETVTCDAPRCHC